MDDPTLTIGRVQVTAITDGAEDIGPITESFPAIPVEGLLSYRERFPSLYGGDDAWHIFIRVWLISHPGGLLLLDTGVGHADWFPAEGRLQEALVAAGVTPTDIDTVVISHTHDDHIGGNVTPQGTPAFPNARYVIQAADVATERAWADEAEENRQMWDDLLQPLIDADVLDQIDGDHVLTDLLRLEHAPGHTPGHQILHVEDAGARLVLTADTWNHPSQFAHPEWPSGADADHELAAATRRLLLPAVTSNPPPILGPTHFAEAFGTVVTDPDGEPGWAPHTG